MSVEYPFQNCGYIRRSAVDCMRTEKTEKCEQMPENCLFLSGEENEKPESTRRSRSPPKVNHFQRVTSYRCLPSLVDVCFRVRQLSCLQNDRTNEEMTANDHITSALSTEVIIIICWLSDRVKIDRQDIFNQQDTERLISPIFKTPSLVRAIPVFYRKWYQ